MSNASRQLTTRHNVEEVALDLFCKTQGYTGKHRSAGEREWPNANRDNYLEVARDLIGRENLIAALVATNKKLRIKLRRRGTDEPIARAA